MNNNKENINMSNSISDNKAYLEAITKRMDRTEEQITEIKTQIQNLTDSVINIQNKYENKAQANTVIDEYHMRNSNDYKQMILEPLKEAKTEPGKRKAKHYKEKEKRKKKNKIDAKIDEKIESKIDAKIDEKINEKIDAKIEFKTQKNVNSKTELKEPKSVDSKKDSKVDTKTGTKKKTRKLGWIGEIAFYTIVIAVVLGAFMIRSNSNGGQPISIAGYSFFTVLTGSMQDEIPQGSLVISKKVDSDSLKIGDDITFMANPSTVVTHRIITIVEQYQDTGERAFETKGTMNERPDKNLVPSVNVIGKVVYQNKFIGQAATFVGNNWVFLIFVVIVIFIFASVMRRILKEDN